MATDEPRRITPPTTEAEAEGHIKRFTRATDQPEPDREPEVEGHALKRGAQPGTDREPETEGHRWVNIKATGQPSTDEPDVAGHAARGVRAAGLPVDLATEDEGFEDPGDDTEGHAMMR